MSALQPTQEELVQVAGVIKSGCDHQNHAAVERSTHFLNEHSCDPKFNACLAVIACTVNATDDLTRAQAALQLKQNITRSFDALKANIDLIKQQLMGALNDSNPHLRRALAQCIVEIAKEGSWPSLLQDLWPRYRESQDAGFRTGVLIVIRDVCEDAADTFCEDGNVIVPELLRVVREGQDPNEVLIAVTSCYNLLNFESDDQRVHDTFFERREELFVSLQRCIQLSNTPTHGKPIVQNTLNCFRMMMYYHDKLEKERVQQIFKLVYDYTGSNDLDISLTACEFWYDLTGETAPAALTDLRNMGLLPELLDMLLNKMRFSDEEVAGLEEEEQAEQLKPKYSHRRRNEEDDDDDDTVEQWTVRKCAASTLDALSITLQDATTEGAPADHQGGIVTPPGKSPGWLLTEQILPRLQTQGNWRATESAMLALGAISLGCYDAVKQFLPQLVPAMLLLVQDSNNHYLVRSMTYWTLGRYVTYVASEKQCFDKTLGLLLTAMTAKERKVQESAVSTFATLLEDQSRRCFDEGAECYLKEDPAYLSAILSRVGECLTPGKYTIRNLVILLDAMRAVVTLFPTDVASEQGRTCLFKPLIEGYFLNLSSDDPLYPNFAFPIFMMVQAMRDQFPYLSQVYMKALTVVGQYFEYQTKLAQGQMKLQEVPDLVNSLCGSLEILRQIISVAADKSPEYATQLVCETKYPGSNFSLVDFALMPMTQPQLDVEQEVLMATLNFVGDHMPMMPEKLLQPCVEHIGNILALILDDEGNVIGSPLANDTAWVCGEIILAMDNRYPAEQLSRAVWQMANKFIPVIISSPKPEDINAIYAANLVQNFALSVGKFGLVAPNILAPQAEAFIAPLLNVLAAVPEFNGSDEKARALLGAVQMIQANFAVMQSRVAVEALAKAMSFFRGLQNNHQVLEAMLALLKQLKVAYGAHWASIAQEVRFPEVLISRLQ
eukprot:TRINITY_DN7107_c0_g1_i1.p1 TRINITY_DN7107_c0_g1~~TRINITY_DN7107_c0_g1_i1.p1  ORF type:complete len:949 (+),score=316.23 TRINITY_DN7107_c0_g1_i1:49-2895(+)